MDDEADGIFNIALSDSDAEETPAKPARRTDQTEAAFQEVKASYSARIENGNVCKPLPYMTPTLYSAALADRQVSKAATGP